MMKNAVYLFTLLFAVSGCIEPYEAKTDTIDSILVVEGFITCGTTKITLSKTVGVNEDLWMYIWGWGNENSIYMNDASVYVECDDDTQTEAVHSSGNGIYLIETGELNVHAKYRLAIHLNNEIYHSEYLAPAVSPPVEVAYRCTYQIATSDWDNYQKGDTIRVNYTDVLVSTKGYEHQPGYYLWSYQEDWEIRALANGDLCWRKDSSRVYLLGSTERLSENTVRGQKIHTIFSSDDRVSQRYRIQVKQNAIHKDAYDYFENQKKNSELSGSLFGVIPSELMGNIRCTTNPNIYVIGYVDVSTTTSDELYLNRRDCFDLQSENISQCITEIGDEIIITNPTCLDCTLLYGVTKNKPKDWKY
jgi:hypothetical protein